MTLSILIWLPLVISLRRGRVPPSLVGRVAAVGSLVTLGIAISFLARFKLGHAGLQFVTDDVWISALGIHYKLGLDGLNVALVMLTTILFSVAVAWSSFKGVGAPAQLLLPLRPGRERRARRFLRPGPRAVRGLLRPDAHPVLLPDRYVGRGPDRVRATTKLVIYTLVGSFFMLVAAVATGVLASSDHSTPINFTFSALRALPLPHASQEWIFLCFAFAFLVKMPLVPFHGWLADGYKAMPIPAVAVFSGVVSKVAAYGFLRIVLPLFPYASAHFQTLMLLIALVSIFWATLVAFTTPDARMVVGLFERRPAQLHHPGNLLAASPAIRARCSRCSTTA